MVACRFVSSLRWSRFHYWQFAAVQDGVALMQIWHDVAGELPESPQLCAAENGLAERSGRRRFA
jgi:hypothetical protein